MLGLYTYNCPFGFLNPSVKPVKDNTQKVWTNVKADAVRNGHILQQGINAVDHVDRKCNNNILKLYY